MRLALVITLKRGLLLFWALWLSVVVTTNVLDRLPSGPFLPYAVVPVRIDWSWINRTMDPLDVPRPVQALMFSGVVLWEALAAALFWPALVAYRGLPLGQEPTVIAASAVNLGLWAAFQVLDEVFLAYSPEVVHRDIFVSQLLTLVVLCVLSDPPRVGPSSPGGL